MDCFIFIIIAMIFFVISYRVGINKELYLLNTIDKEDASKIKNKKFVAKKFGLYYLFLGIISTLCAYITKLLGSVGLGLSMVILMILFFISVGMAINLYWSIKE